MIELIGKIQKSEPHLPGKRLISEQQMSLTLFSQILAQSCPKKYQMLQGHLKVILKK